MSKAEREKIEGDLAYFKELADLADTRGQKGTYYHEQVARLTAVLEAAGGDEPAESRGVALSTASPDEVKN